MQVKNIECQIAQAQLRRYLTGEDMPNSIVTDLETHLRHCAECMDSAHSLRESLKGVLHAKVTGKPVAVPAIPRPKLAAAPTPEPTEPEPGPEPARAVVQTPADLLNAPDKDFRPKKTANKSNWKTLAYSGALALVLILMSTVFKDPTQLFGPRASSVTQDTPPATETQPAPTSEPTTDPVTNVTQADPQPTTETVPTEPATTGAGETKPLQTSGLIVADGSGTQTVKADAPKAQAKPTNRPKPKPKPNRQGGGKPGNGTIKVYPPDK
jgi:hypothetical protein